MKQLGIWCLIILGMLLAVPMVTVFGGGFYDASLLANVQTMNTGGEDIESKEDEKELISALAKMVSVDEQEEVLKAHAVMIRTYRMRRKLGIVSEGELSYMTQEEMKTLWQKDYDKNYKRLEDAVKETSGLVMYCNNELIEPIYHKASAGMTRDAKGIYNMDIPYLKPVVSEDEAVEDIIVTKEEVVSTLQSVYPTLVVQPSFLEQQIQIIAKDQGGYIESLQVGNSIIDGESFRKLFKLPSACFTMSYDDTSIQFRVKGIGHGVGLSQEGAIRMAKAGATYEEILKYYYTDIEIKNF